MPATCLVWLQWAGSSVHKITFLSKMYPEVAEWRVTWMCCNLISSPPLQAVLMPASQNDGPSTQAHKKKLSSRPWPDRVNAVSPTTLNKFSQDAKTALRILKLANADGCWSPCYPLKNAWFLFPPLHWNVLPYCCGLFQCCLTKYSVTGCQREERALAWKKRRQLN